MTNKYSSELKEQAINMYIAGVPTYKIKNSLNIKTVNSITNWVREAGIERRPAWTPESMLKWRYAVRKNNV